MSCTCQPPATGTQYAGCVGQTIVDPQPDGLMKQYAARVGAPTSGPSAWISCVVSAALQTRRMIYFKLRPGDCGQKTKIDIGVTGQAGAAIGFAASADSEPISQGILAGVSAIFSGLTAHHIQAVATEQATLCDVANAYNQNAFAIEQAVQAGDLTPQQAAGAIQQVVAQLQGNIAQIAKTGNAAYGYGFALDALVLWNSEMVYPALYRAPAVISQQTAAAPGSPGVIVGQGTAVVSGTPVDLTSAVDAILGGQVSPNSWGLIAAAGLVVVVLVAM